MNRLDAPRTGIAGRLFASRAGGAVWAVLALLALVAPLVANQRQTYVLMHVLVLAVFATSFNVILGYTGMVSFAHGAYYGVGAYTMTLLWLHLGWPPLLGFVAAPVITAVVAYVTGLIALRAVQLYFALLTLALGQLLFVVAFQWRGLTRGDDGIHGIPLPAFLGPPTNRYYFLLFATVVALGILGAVMHSPFGATLQAIRENSERAGFLGIKVKRYQLASFTLGGAFAGYAGGMFVVMDRGTFPLLMHWTTSAEPIFVTLIGGLNSFIGPAIGAIIFGLLQDWITRRFVFWGLILGVVLLLIILRMPGGTVEGVQRLAAWLSEQRRGGTDADTSDDETTSADDEPSADQRQGTPAGGPTSGGER